MKDIKQIQEWQPIETAPEGKGVLIAGGKASSVCSGSSEWFINDNVHLGIKYSHNEAFTVNDYFECKPTHWMPLPNPPKED